MSYEVCKNLNNLVEGAQDPTDIYINLVVVAFNFKKLNKDIKRIFFKIILFFLDKDDQDLEKCFIILTVVMNDMVDDLTKNILEEEKKEVKYDFQAVYNKLKKQYDKYFNLLEMPEPILPEQQPRFLSFENTPKGGGYPNFSDSFEIDVDQADQKDLYNSVSKEPEDNGSPIKEPEKVSDSKGYKVVSKVKTVPKVAPKVAPKKTVAKTVTKVAPKVKKVSTTTKGTKSKKEEKYDKQYQKKETPLENDALYIFYTTLYKENPNSKIAIKFLTEHGVYDGDKRKQLIEKYVNLFKT